MKLDIEDVGKGKLKDGFTLFRKTGRIEIGIRHTIRKETIGKGSI